MCRVKCSICGHDVKETYLDRHTRRKHKDIISLKKAPERIKCPVCQKEIKKTYVDNHIWRYHKGLISHKEIINRIKCPICGEEINKKCLSFHRRKYHNDVAIVRKNNIICSLCGERFAFRFDFRSHVGETHEQIVENSFKSNSFENFLEWLKTEEQLVQIRFVKATAPKLLATGSIRLNYYCQYDNDRHRAVIPQEKRQKTLKSQGSHKLDGNCPAQIIVEKHVDGPVDVTYFSTHIGHNSSSDHFQLSHEDKLEIAGGCELSLQFDIGCISHQKEGCDIRSSVSARFIHFREEIVVGVPGSSISVDIKDNQSEKELEDYIVIEDDEQIDEPEKGSLSAELDERMQESEKRQKTLHLSKEVDEQIQHLIEVKHTSRNKCSLSQLLIVSEHLNNAILAFTKTRKKVNQSLQNTRTPSNEQSTAPRLPGARKTKLNTIDLREPTLRQEQPTALLLDNDHESSELFISNSFDHVYS